MITSGRKKKPATEDERLWLSEGENIAVVRGLGIPLAPTWATAARRFLSCVSRARTHTQRIRGGELRETPNEKTTRRKPPRQGNTQGRKEVGGGLPYFV